LESQKVWKVWAVFDVLEVWEVDVQKVQWVQKVGDWGFRKVGASFPYFLFLVSYSLFPFRSLLLCELCVKKKVHEVEAFIIDI